VIGRLVVQLHGRWEKGEACTAVLSVWEGERETERKSAIFYVFSLLFSLWGWRLKKVM